MNKKPMLLITTIFLFITNWQLSVNADTELLRAHKTGPITYAEVGNLYLGSFGAVEDPKSAKQEQTEKKLDLTIPTFSHQQLLTMLFGIYASQERIEGPVNELIEDALRATLKDSDVYVGSGKDPKETLMHHINNTQTVFGEAALAYLLAHPVDISVLKKRQAFIKELVHNEALFIKLDTILAKVKGAQHGFFSFFKPEDPVTDDYTKQLYWSLSGLNKSTLALETRVRGGNIGTFFQAGGSTILTYIIADVIKSKIINRHASLGKLILQAPGNILKDIRNTYRRIWTRPTDQIERFAYYGAWINAIIYPLVIGATAYQAKVAIGAAREVRDTINYLQTRLIDVATLVKACNQFEELTQEFTQMKEGLLNHLALSNLLNGSSRADDFSKLIDRLQTNTFEGTASFFSLSGRVLATYKLMQAEKNAFVPALTAVGEIDACLSMAKLVKKMDHEPVNYCFVNFVETERPYLKLLDFWNPFIHPNKVVPNSIELGQGAEAHHVIMTGSNTGGKSTILKAMVILMTLAHTFGIGPAKECTLSPFGFAGSFLRIHDDTASDESKFKAEVLRAKLLTKIMDSLPKNKFGFMVIDELFAGTGTDKGAAAAVKVAQKLADANNCMYLLATHFPALTELEKTNDGIIKNYKADAYKDAQGIVHRPFKLEPGISTVNIANDILNEEIKDIDFDL